MSHTINWLESEDAREVEAWLVYNEANTRIRLGAVNRELVDNPEIKKAFQSAMSVCALYAMRKIRTAIGQSAFASPMSISPSSPTETPYQAARPLISFGKSRSQAS
jgi:hypothetical protein